MDSQVRNKLFCWYCVLFSVNKNPYNSVGYDNLKEIHRALVKHEISKEHIHSAIKFKLFGKQNIVNAIDSGHKEYIKKYNEKVRENREMVKRLINMTIFCLHKNWHSGVMMNQYIQIIKVILKN
jgi:hypothetical protein